MSEDQRGVPASPPLAPSTTRDLGGGPDSTTTQVALPPAAAVGDSESPPPSRSTTRDSSPSTLRRRGRTLRIPDDEVSRPQIPGLDAVSRDSTPPPIPAALPTGSSARPSPAMAPPSSAPLTPMRIIALNPIDFPAAEPPRPISSAPPPAAARGPATDDGRTPLQPPISSDDLPTVVMNIGARPGASSTDDFAVDSDVTILVESRPGPVPDDPETTVPSGVPVPDSDSPLVLEFAPESEDAEHLEPSRIPAPPTASEPEGEDVRFEEELFTPAVPTVVSYVEAPETADSGRSSDPGAEVAIEDVVVMQPLPPARHRPQSHPPIPPASSKKLSAVPPPTGKPPLVIVPPHVGAMAPQSDASGLRRKGRLWWEELFNDDYLRSCEKLTDEQIAREVDFVEDSLGIERGGAVLDLACGTGRHSIELARRGYEVVGFDLSLAMLARAGEDAQDREAKLNFVQGDMREMTFDEQFDGVFSWNTSFGYFEEEKNALVIDRIHRSLRAGGLFLLDVVNRDFLVRQSPSLAWFEGDGCVCMDEMSVDFITSRMKIKRTMMLDDGRSREIEYSLRIYSLHELGKMLHDHGFKVCEVSGRLATPGVFFGNESPRTIILAEKR